MPSPAESASARDTHHSSLHSGDAAGRLSDSLALSFKKRKEKGAGAKLLVNLQTDSVSHSELGGVCF